MRVEVNEHNIARYKLDELTGNDKEILLHAARLAELEGEKLTCEVPDMVGDRNIFEDYPGSPSQSYDRQSPLIDEAIHHNMPSNAPYVVVEGEVLSVKDN